MTLQSSGAIILGDIQGGIIVDKYYNVMKIPKLLPLSLPNGLNVTQKGNNITLYINNQQYIDVFMGVNNE